MLNKRRIITEADRRKAKLDSQKRIVESFDDMYSRIKRTDESDDEDRHWEKQAAWDERHSDDVDYGSDENPEFHEKDSSDEQIKLHLYSDEDGEKFKNIISNMQARTYVIFDYVGEPKGGNDVYVRIDLPHDPEWPTTRAEDNKDMDELKDKLINALSSANVNADIEYYNPSTDDEYQRLRDAEAQSWKQAEIERKERLRAEKEAAEKAQAEKDKQDSIDRWGFEGGPKVVGKIDLSKIDDRGGYRRDEGVSESEGVVNNEVLLDGSESKTLSYLKVPSESTESGFGYLATDIIRRLDEVTSDDPAVMDHLQTIYDKAKMALENGQEVIIAIND